MNYTNAVVWGCLVIGALLAALLGRMANTWGAKVGTSIGLGVFLFFVVNVALAACVEAKLCPALGDTGITYTLYPFLAIPVFYLVARISKNQGTAATGSKK